MTERDFQPEEITARLRARGYRLTPQRVAVLRALAEGKGHPSVEAIYERVRTDLPTTSLATIYKTLALLKEMGEVREVHLGDECTRYDLAGPRPHPHLVCVRCRCILDLHGVSLEEVVQGVARQSGFHVLGYRLTFLGLCPQCQDEGEK